MGGELCSGTKEILERETDSRRGCLKVVTASVESVLRICGGIAGRRFSTAPGSGLRFFHSVEHFVQHPKRKKG